MDCEKFETHVIDALYDELDEVTHAAMKRHMDGCSRCAGVMSGLRATREVGVLPIEEPSDDLEERILAAATAIQKKAPWHRKVVRGIAWAGSHAMRPQLAMAAVLVLMLGSSLLLLRAKPGTAGVAPIRVTERGVPEPDRGEAFVEAPPPAVARAAAETAMASPTAAATAGEGASEAELDRKRTEKGKDEGDKDVASAGAGAKDGKEATEALAEARAAKSRSGCEAAVGKYDDVGSRFPRTPSAAAAMWEAAECYKSMGEGSKAREIFMALRSVDGYQQKVDGEIASAEAQGIANQQQNVGAPGGGQAAAARGAPASPAKARMAEAPAPAPPAPPAAASRTTGSSPAGQGRNAAPAPKAPAKSAADAAF